MQSMLLSLQSLNNRRRARLDFGSLRRELATSFLLSLGALLLYFTLARFALKP